MSTSRGPVIPPAVTPPAVTLALDTATPYLTLALSWPGGALERVQEVGRASAERLADETRALFAEAGLPFQAQTIVIGTGPGSYTGVRVGASYALGLTRVWGAEVRGVSTLESLVRGDGPQAVSLDARKGNVYSAVYEVSAGTVTDTVQPVARRPLAEFEAELSGLPHWRDPAPSGLALLRAGLAHGVKDWELAYL